MQILPNLRIPLQRQFLVCRPNALQHVKTLICDGYAIRYAHQRGNFANFIHDGCTIYTDTKQVATVSDDIYDSSHDEYVQIVLVELNLTEVQRLSTKARHMDQ